MSSTFPGFVLLLCLLALLPVFSSACGSQTFVSAGYACNDTQLCKNFLQCINGVCTEPSFGSNCSSSASVCGDAAGPLYCNSNHTCDARFRENGDPCAENAQCLSGSCQNYACVGSLNANASCDIGSNPFACVLGTFCGANEANSSASDSCQAPLPRNASCISSLLKWTAAYGSNASVPIPICAAGLVCDYTTAARDAASCVPLFGGVQNSTCVLPSVSLQSPNGTLSYFPADVLSVSYQCAYNLTCQSVANSTPICNASSQASPLNCSASTAASPQCPPGKSCGCALQNSGAQPTCDTVVFVNECEQFMEDLLQCVAQNNCPYRPSLLPQPKLGGPNDSNANGAGTFASIAYPPWCVSRQCSLQHRRFLCCQNNQTLLNAAQLSATPLNLPQQNGYCTFNSGWPNWVVPVIVLGGIVFVIGVIVIFYVIFRRKPDSDYDPINAPK